MCALSECGFYDLNFLIRLECFERVCLLFLRVFIAIIIISVAVFIWFFFSWLLCLINHVACVQNDVQSFLVIQGLYGRSKCDRSFCFATARFVARDSRRNVCRIIDK